MERAEATKWEMRAAAAWGAVTIALLVALLIPAIPDDLWTTYIWSAEAAGWTQAIGAIVAILVAIVVPVRHAKSAHRELDRRRLNNLAVLSDHALTAANDFLSAMETEGNRFAYGLHYAPVDWEGVIAAFDTVAVNELQTYEIIEAVLEIREKLRRLRYFDEHQPASGDNEHNWEETLEELHDLRRKVGDSVQTIRDARLALG
jgi:hypothetical protein